MASRRSNFPHNVKNTVIDIILIQSYGVCNISLNAVGLDFEAKKWGFMGFFLPPGVVPKCKG